MADLVLYTRSNCGLCDRLKSMISTIIDDDGRDDLRLVEVDIDSDPGLIEQFRYRVPVVMHEDAVILEGKPDEQEVRQALEATD